MRSIDGSAEQDFRKEDLRKCQELLSQFLVSPDEAYAKSILEKVMVEHALPIIRRVIRIRLGNAGENQDISDMESGVALQLLARLRAIRQGDAEPISDFNSYVVSVAINACHARLRSRYPERAKLKNRLRYLLERDKRFSLWNLTGEWVCGKREWEGRAGAVPVAGSGAKYALDDLGTAVRDIFTDAGRPMPFDSLVAAVVDATGLSEPVEEPFEDLPGGPGGMGSPGAMDTGVETVLVQRSDLAGLWREVRELPANQRAALLLNLRDSEGNGIIEFFPSTGTASIRDLAAAVSIRVEEFATLWKDLPLNDLAIATRLGLTRQQVINLRKSARFRLARRLQFSACGGACGNFSRPSASTPSEEGEGDRG